jgi:pantothenate kinase
MGTPLREQLLAATPTIYAPSFDHAVKDPTPDAIGITPRHRVVLIEGLYTLLSVEPWRQAAELLEGRWIIRMDLTEARQRLVKRHVVTGVTSNWEEGYRRSEENDMPSEWWVSLIVHPNMISL